MCALLANSDDGAVEKKVRRENIRTSEEKKIALMREAVTPHVVDFDSTTWAVCQAIRKVDPENLHEQHVPALVVLRVLECQHAHDAPGAGL